MNMFREMFDSERKYKVQINYKVGEVGNIDKFLIVCIINIKKPHS